MDIDRLLAARRGTPISIRLAPGLLGLALVGCATQAYEADPLTADDFERVTRDHFEGEPRLGRDVPLTPLLVTAVFHDRNPRLRQALAGYDEARAIADVDVPLANPALSLGPQFVFGADPGVPDVVAVGGIELTIPLSDRRGLQDAVAEERARAAATESWASFRELTCEVRGAYWRYGVQLERERRQVELAEASDGLIETAEGLVEAGIATALDVSLFRLESARTSARVFEARIERTQAAGELAEFLAVGTNRLGGVPLEYVPESGLLPELPGLYDLVLERSPALLRMRAAYAVAERELHLEIGKQVPDLVIGGAFGGNPGDSTEVLGLTLGIELPIFDKNEREIAAARARRERLRVQYEAEVHRVWGEVEQARLVLEYALQRHWIVREDVLPAAITSAETARQALRAGTANALQLLDAERSLREAKLEVLDAWSAELVAWTELERAVAAPLLLPELDGDTPNDHPDLPDLTETDAPTDGGQR
jgi:outer membrane protein, heavy metal efflux system